jgi:hypothetical protein
MTRALSPWCYVAPPTGWTIVDSDGGAYVAEILKGMHVPQADIAPLLKAYQ